MLPNTSIQPVQYSINQTQPALRFILFILGIVLLSASILKAHGLLVGPVPPLSMFYSPRWQFAFIELEAVVGLWFLSGVNTKTAWLAGIGVFVFLAAVSLYMIIMGETSCGCFGRVEVSPWSALMIDLVSLIALWRWRPRPFPFMMFNSDSQGVNAQSYTGLIMISLVIALLVIVALDGWATTSLARLRGSSLIIEPEVVDLGIGVRGEERVFSVKVRNLSDRVIRLVGGMDNCNCFITNDLPLSIPPREERDLAVVARLKGGDGNGQQAFAIFSDDESQPVVVGRYARRLIGSAHH